MQQVTATSSKLVNRLIITVILLFFFSCSLMFGGYWYWGFQSAVYPNSSLVQQNAHWLEFPYVYAWRSEFKTLDPHDTILEWYQEEKEMSVASPRFRGSCQVVTETRGIDDVVYIFTLIYICDTQLRVTRTVELRPDR